MYQQVPHPEAKLEDATAPTPCSRRRSAPTSLSAQFEEVPPVKIAARRLFLALVALFVTGCANDGPLQSALGQGVGLHWSIPIPVEGGLASNARSVGIAPDLDMDTLDPASASALEP
jgi:hypothetical protein